MNPTEPHNASTASAAWQKHPYNILPAIQALRQDRDMDGSDAEILAARVAVAMPDMAALDDVLGDRAPLFDNFYAREEVSTPSTVDTIDTFLATFGKADPRETDALSKLIFNPVPDYAAVLGAEATMQVSDESVPLSEQDRLINAFIEQNNATENLSEAQAGPALADTVQPVASDKLTNEVRGGDAPSREADNSSLTESLARVMIKNRNYKKALEIISELSLKNPEKSIYFADQIRFLRKLIINEKQ
jgi:hypothetical protein